jgi:hypothetical protein
MPGLVPGIHVLLSATFQDVDGRDKPGHDDVQVIFDNMTNQNFTGTNWSL